MLSVENRSQPVTNIDDRAEFEKYYTDGEYELSRNCDKYLSNFVDEQWKGWQARAKLSTAALAEKDAEIEQMRRVLRCETSEDAAAFVANWLRGTIVIPDELRVRMLPEIARLQRVVEASKMLLADIEDYQQINNLGGEKNHSQVSLREALAAAQQER
jgi:hypothetical protein